MKRGLLALLMAYVLSQFYRAFLPVLAPVLAIDIGATADDLARASGIWFLIFAAMQIPVGTALDSIGPRKIAAILFIFGGAGGALLFGFAQTPAHVMIAMGLIGIGCSPVLMASYYILARSYAPAVFGSLAGAMIGFGTLGNLAGSAPLAWSVQTFGWRESMLGLAVISLAVGLLLLAVVRDPVRLATGERGSVLQLLKMPALWPIMAMMLVNYAPAAGLRGLWAGPYMADVFAADVGVIGRVTFVMGAGMILGSFLFGPLERLFRSRKWVIFAGNVSGLLALIALDGAAGLFGRVRHGDAGNHRHFRVIICGHYCACQSVLPRASDGARCDVDEPVWHRRGRDHAVCVRADLCRIPNRHSDRRLCRSVRGFCDFDRPWAAVPICGHKTVSTKPFSLAPRRGKRQHSNQGSNKWVIISSSLVPQETWATKC